MRISPPSAPIRAVEVVRSTVPKRSPPEVEADPSRRSIIGGIGGRIIVVIDDLITRGNHHSWPSIPFIDGHTPSDQSNQRNQYQQFFHRLTPYLTGTGSYCKIHAIVFPLKNSFYIACFCPQIIPPVLKLYNFHPERETQSSLLELSLDQI